MQNASCTSCMTMCSLIKHERLDSRCSFLWGRPNSASLSIVKEVCRVEPKPTIKCSACNISQLLRALGMPFQCNHCIVDERLKVQKNKIFYEKGDGWNDKDQFNRGKFAKIQWMKAALISIFTAPHCFKWTTWRSAEWSYVESTLVLGIKLVEFESSNVPAFRKIYLQALTWGKHGQL